MIKDKSISIKKEAVYVAALFVACSAISSAKTPRQIQDLLDKVTDSGTFDFVGLQAFGVSINPPKKTKCDFVVSSEAIDRLMVLPMLELKKLVFDIFKRRMDNAVFSRAIKLADRFKTKVKDE